ncbi:Clavaminate synthase-like protein [Aaosphaeria arxii CBS 175.79]|uniref:Clavaminate synthase-like protein n=1 Tax=Aaosphaeria arxii CBS 175.79 TaxID=1450172 RepID=A0A6A5X725_9PLEO|nr:Clavaminate synthase-like protein [Aaosphaeria arxii CBS 175.79]KAF2008763.1 Clavaminate synthase-like protein [Aaosphaeria arxii CBS 175.79]
MATETATKTYSKIQLLTLNGPEYRRVSTAPPRAPLANEIPLIDLGQIDGDLAARKEIAQNIRLAAENTGFFYVYNHGISPDLIRNALHQAQAFFDQPINAKEKVSRRKYENFQGYHGVGTTQINDTETKDNKETFSIRYDESNDPLHANSPTQPTSSSRSLDELWTGVSHLPGFRTATVEFWQQRLNLARKLVRILALALDLEESYFDDVITHPGADALYIHYPGVVDPSDSANVDVGIGSHTDIQCFTLLWQDNSGGLQVLSNEGEWIDAKPIEGTFVVNIADFLQRLSNNRFKSTVHRVYNRQTASRYSMPFFLGFNADSVCSVVPTCVDEEHPPLYEPISCGKWHHDRLALASLKKT